MSETQYRLWRARRNMDNGRVFEGALALSEENDSVPDRITWEPIDLSQIVPHEPDRQAGQPATGAENAASFETGRSAGVGEAPAKTAHDFGEGLSDKVNGMARVFAIEHNLSVHTVRQFVRKLIAAALAKTTAEQPAPASGERVWDCEDCGKPAHPDWFGYYPYCPSCGKKRADERLQFANQRTADAKRKLADYKLAASAEADNAYEARRQLAECRKELSETATQVCSLLDLGSKNKARITELEQAAIQLATLRGILAKLSAPLTNASHAKLVEAIKAMLAAAAAPGAKNPKGADDGG